MHYKDIGISLIDNLRKLHSIPFLFGSEVSTESFDFAII